MRTFPFRLVLLLVLLTGAASRASAACGTTYTLNPAVPATANWTDTSAWVPVGYPGSGVNDCVDSGTGVTTTLIVNSAIPNAVAGIQWHCTGCIIDVTTGGQLNVSVTGVVDNGAFIAVDGGTLTVDAPMPSGLAFNSGTSLYLKSGTLAGSGTVYIEPGATLEMPFATAPVIDTVYVANEGTINLTPNAVTTLTLANGATLSNLSGATLNIDTNVSLIDNSGGGTISNGGGLVTLNGGGTTTLNVALYNSGATGVQITDGELAVQGGGSGDAPFSVGGDSVLSFPSNSYATTTNGVISGSGTLAITGGTLTLGGLAEIGHFAMTAGTLTGNGFLTAASTFDWSGGTLTGTGTTQIEGTGVGTFDGANAAMNVDGRPFDNYGTIFYTATTNPLTLLNGAVFANYGSFVIQDDGGVACDCTVPPLFRNSPNGQFYKSSGAGTSAIDVPFSNDYGVAIYSGVLEFNNDGTHNGNFFGLNGTELRFTGDHTFDNSSIYSEGDVSFIGATTDIASSYEVNGTTTLNGGTLSITSSGAKTKDFVLVTGTLDVDDFSMHGNGTWSCGTIDGASFTVTDTGTLTIDGANSTMYLAVDTLTNDGTINYTATDVSGNALTFDDGTLVNNGLFDIQSDAPIDLENIIVLNALTPTPAANAIYNLGTFQKSSIGTTSVEPDFYTEGTLSAQDGTLEFLNDFEQSGGETILEGGSISGDFEMTGGELTGDGTFDGNVTNNGGTVAPGTSTTTGVIDMLDYTQTSGTMSIKIGGSSAGQFDQVNADSVTLDDTFTATLINGYEPPNGTTFDVFTFASRSGAFATENLPTYQVPHGSMTSNYQPTVFRLTALLTPPSADLTIGMGGPSSVNAGAPLAYLINVSNSGPDTISSTITVTNTLPAGATSASGSGTGWSCGAPVGGVITCTNNTVLPSGQSLAVLTMSMTAPVTAGSVSNSATATSSVADPTTPNTASGTTTVVGSADLAITKSGPGGVTSGQNIVYTITVTNNGPSQATGVIVSDPTPANATFVLNSGACVTAFPCNLGTLNSGQSVVITSTFSTSPSFSGNVTNTATVSSTTSDPNNANDSASAITNVGAQADLAISKSGPASANVGDPLVYTISVTNNGPSPATNVVVSDITPTGIAFQSNSGACASAYPCNLGTLNSGQTAIITSTYSIPTNYAGASVINTATATSDVNDPDSSDNTSAATTTITPEADLGIDKSGPPSIAPGQLIIYTLSITNAGPTSATSVVVADPTPAGLTWISNSGDCVTAFPCNLGTLTSGATASITATFSVPANYAGTSVSNTATISSATFDGNSANDSSTEVTPVVAQADLSIVKSGPAFFDAAQDVVYTITVTNLGPLTANNIFVADATPPGLTFVSNSGACAGAFPCALGTLASGQSAVITSTFHVPIGYAGTTITNTASVSASTLDIAIANNSSTVTTPRATGAIADLSIIKQGPGSATSGSTATFELTIRNNGPMHATSITVSDPTPAGLTFLSSSGACPTGFPCTITALAPGQSAVTEATYFVQAAPGASITNVATVTSAASDPTSSNDSSSATTEIVAAILCPTTAPVPLTPANNATVTSPVTLTWTVVDAATQYVVTISGPQSFTTNVTSTEVNLVLAAGTYTWTVGAIGDGCTPFTSAPRTFVVCGDSLEAPAVGAVAETTTGQTYSVSWNQIGAAKQYELQQSNDEGFTAPQSFTQTETTHAFTKNVATPTPFFYRVRAMQECGSPSAYSPTVRVVVAPVPSPDTPNFNVNVPAGSTTPVTFQLFVPGLPEGSATFIATADKPWLTVVPSSGIVPPAGVRITIAADPSKLVNGTWTGTILIAYGTVSVAGSVAANANTPTVSIPVSISLVTPVIPGEFSEPSNSALIIPAVGHLSGVDSTWRSDMRIANTSPDAVNYRLRLNKGSGDPNTLLAATTITVDAGATTALDNLVRTWFGNGSLGESSNGALIIEPLDADGKPLAALSPTTFVSSRTFNASSNGTFGQFIPALPYASFITRALNTGRVPTLSLQQVSQSNALRTNLGLLEASGRPVSALISVFNEGGIKLFDLPLQLAGGQQQQLNGFLANNGITLPNGRIEAQVIEGEGKVTAYASVVDNLTNDPFLVFGVPLDGASANRFVLPGVADLDNGFATWRSDVRLFNAGDTPQLATLTFFPTGEPTRSSTREVAIAPGEVKALDGVLRSLFGLTNAGGALHVTTPDAAPLIVSARTFDQRPGGTVGQFVPAVAPNEAVGSGERALHVLQAEESVRYRTNLGVAEVSGHSAVVEIEVNLPDSKVRPVVTVPLAANEFRQFPILSDFGLGSIYNARITIRVIEGEGRVTAYGSVIDRTTGDPTYIPPQ